MGKIKTWIKDHYQLIIGLLIMVIMLKGCNSCNMERRMNIKKHNMNM